MTAKRTHHRPHHTTHDATPPARSPVQAPAQGRHEGKPQIPKILVVDDELDVLRSTQMLIERLGYACLVVPAADHVMDVLVAERPDLVIQDVVMPTLDLRALVERMRADPRTAAIPVVLFSASDDLPDMAADLDVAGYIHKPFAEHQLREILERVVGPAPAKPAPVRAGSVPSTQRDVLAAHFHEQRNTLTALNNYAQFLLNSSNIHEPEREAAEEINRLLLDLEKRHDLLRNHLLGDA